MAKKVSKKSKAQSKEKKIKTVSATKKEKRIKQKQKIINFVSGNKNKLKELSDIFKENFKDIEIKQLDIDLPELQGLPEDIVKGKLKLALEKAMNDLKTRERQMYYLLILCYKHFASTIIEKEKRRKI